MVLYKIRIVRDIKTGVYLYDETYARHTGLRACLLRVPSKPLG